jgi:1-acyl-sn-glycerol-3-phosphate acyltransferase
MIPIRREDPSAASHAFDELRAVLDRGGVVAIYPEGTRSRDGLLHKGHTGAAHLSLLTGAPLVPVGIHGTDHILPTGSRLVRPFSKAEITLGTPIIPAVHGPEASTNRRRRQLTDELMREIARLSGEAYVNSYAEMPRSTSALASSAG